MNKSWLFQFLYINVLNYRYFTLTVQRLKKKKRRKNKKR